MSRPDQSITFLKSFGYSVYRVPRTSASPLDLLHRQGKSKDLTRLGTLSNLIASSRVPAPQIHRDDRPGVDIEGSETSKMNVSIGLSLLGSFIGALGGGNLGLQLGFNRASTVTFRYTGVMEDSIDVLALEQFIGAGTLDPNIPPGTLEKLVDDEMHMTTSILKTAKVVVAAQSESGQSVALDVPVIQQAVGANLKIEASGAVTGGVKFEGAFPIAFAFQAVQLVFDDTNRFLTTQQLPAGDAAARALVLAGPSGASNATRRPVFLDTPGATVRLTD
jgi:hypothetical protein